ncbi:uncharacterized protein LOC119674385 [Teleopsis dalmanni]|uniref:uncharacterized protein LOC119674385 n=1 Tax=Teleopsis dalmanni TaxID=139649 RepID=UPI0018CE8AC2|nr:uncharacterized protein LOC119674385 [Teleopsis dalmanni]
MSNEDKNTPSFLKLKCDRLTKQLFNLSQKLSEDFISCCHEVQLQIYVDTLEQLNDNFEKSQSNLEEENFDEFEGEARSNFSESYVELKTALMIALNNRRSNNVQSSTRYPSTDETSSINIKYSRSRLPELQLPTFNGKITEWPHFYAMFKTIVDSSADLSNLEKLQHLRSCLRDSALDTIKSLEVNDLNYDKSLNLLVKRFDNKRLIFQAHINEMFGLRRVEPNSVEGLRRLSDKINSHLQALSTLGNKEQIADCLIIHLVAQRLDPTSHAKWEERSAFNTIPTWNEMSEFLDKRCQVLEHVTYSTRAAANNNNRGAQCSPINRKTFVTIKSPTSRCTFCNDANHFIYACAQFANLSPKLRLNEARRLSLCLNCLKKGHHLKQCKSSRCRLCSEQHHTLLHFNNLVQTNVSSELSTMSSDLTAKNNTTSTGESYIKASLVSTNSSQQRPNYPSLECVLLATAVILVKNRAGSFVPCRAILDSASQLHFITKSFANQLQLKSTKSVTVVSGIGDGDFVSNSSTELTIQSRFGKYSTNITAVITTKITDQQPSSNINTNDWNIPKNLQLADPTFNNSQRIDVLIGAALFFELLCVGQIRLAPQLPILQKTLLGWIVSGGSQYATPLATLAAFKTTSSQIEHDQSLDQQVKRFWETENCFDSIVKTTKEHLDCETHFRTHFSRNESGEYSVRLPLRLDIDLLGDSYIQALRRFHSLERKLQLNPNCKTQYTAFMKEYLDLNHMSPVADTEACLPKYYLSHHCVLKASSSSTKLRVVFDGSAQTSTGYSLNDILMSGPTIQSNLIDILLRFRSFPIALTADICKMYRCVRITPPDNFLQCILWRNDYQEPLKVYKLDTVTYGTKPAAFLAVRAMQQLAADEAENFPLGSRITLRDFYIDDLITGGSSEHEVLNIMRQTSSLLSKGNFKLRKWSSNQSSVLNDIPEVDREPVLKFDDGSEFTKILGLLWNPTNDNFFFSFTSQQNIKNITKRSILSLIARFYDPLGLIGPVISMAKIFLQQLWKHKLDWDESLPIKLHTAWNSLYNNLYLVRKLTFPRFVSLPNAFVELHAFCDASLDAYGACVYVVSRFEDSVSVNLLCSKSRVSPLKTLTVPKLELCAAVLLAQLINQISKLNIFMGEIHCWSDSSIVLTWIQSEASTFNTFVSNRISRIQHFTEGMTWHHVPTDMNPADILSRGATPNELVKSTLWRFGPSFLRFDHSDWPATFTFQHNLPERRTILISISNITDMSIKFKFINSFEKMQRIFGYVYKFVNKDRSGTLTVHDINLGTFMLIRLVQRANLWTEYHDLERKRLINSSSKLFSLSPFMDNNGLIRVGGRLKNSNLDFNAQHPIILPRNHPLTDAIINHYHRKWLHAGAQSVLASIRLQYWPMGGRKLVSRVINKCITCFRAKPTVARHIMGQLPHERVHPNRAFVITGVDYCGPFYYKSEVRNKHPIKCYICLFICFTTKAVHLEVVKDLTTSAFLAALQRFISTRGKPKTIWSDNATNFCGAKYQLDDLKKLFFSQRHCELVHQQCLCDNIEWKFIPPGSPHFGGLWESAVKTAKYHFYRVAGLAALDFDELRTLVCQISCIINSRPLFPLSDCPDDLNALTPGHFLIGAPFTSFVEPDSTALNINRLGRWQRICFLQQVFWKRWSSEYLTQLQERSKWRQSTANMTIGTMVLIKDNNLPPLHWVLGRVVEVIAGNDGVVRIAMVRTKNGVFKRAVSRLCILPLNDESCNAIVPTGGECLDKS